MKTGLRLGFELSFFYFILNSPQLIHEVTCSRLYLDGKKYEEEIPDNTRHSKKF